LEPAIKFYYSHKESKWYEAKLLELELQVELC